MGQLLHAREIMAQYGLTAYETQTVMKNVPKINVGRGSIPRWVVKQADVEQFLSNETEQSTFSGLDKKGKLIRR